MATTPSKSSGPSIHSIRQINCNFQTFWRDLDHSVKFTVIRPPKFQSSCCFCSPTSAVAVLSPAVSILAVFRSLVLDAVFFSASSEKNPKSNEYRGCGISIDHQQNMLEFVSRSSSLSFRPVYNDCRRMCSYCASTLLKFQKIMNRRSVEVIKMSTSKTSFSNLFSFKRARARRPETRLTPYTAKWK